LTGAIQRAVAARPPVRCRRGRDRLRGDRGALAPVEVRGSAFGLLAAVQSIGNLAASGIAGILWTAVCRASRFGYLVAWMAIALIGLLGADRP
jgi:hypothetical protein